MDRRQAIASLVQKTGVKLDVDDPAFLLVELNALMLDHRVSEATQNLAAETTRLNRVMTENVDDFVAVANEALSKFMTRTHQIKEQLDKLPAPAPTVVAPAQSVAVTALPRWVIPAAFVFGMQAGALVMLLLK